MLNDKGMELIETNGVSALKVSDLCSGGEDETVLYLIEAYSATDAINKLAERDINVKGHKMESDYDCTGQWFADPAREKDCVYIDALGLWSVPMFWRLDVWKGLV